MLELVIGERVSYPQGVDKSEFGVGSYPQRQEARKVKAERKVVGSK